MVIIDPLYIIEPEAISIELMPAKVYKLDRKVMCWQVYVCVFFFLSSPFFFPFFASMCVSTTGGRPPYS